VAGGRRSPLVAIREEFSAAETSRTGKLKITRRAMVGLPDQRHARVRGSALIAVGFHRAAAENISRYFFLDKKSADEYHQSRFALRFITGGRGGLFDNRIGKACASSLRCQRSPVTPGRNEIFCVVE